MNDTCNEKISHPDYEKMAKERSEIAFMIREENEALKKALSACVEAMNIEGKIKRNFNF